jgi:S-adenosylmethionine:tRNA ribosyltransferase-isomerase
VHVAEFDYDLPQGRIAQHPIEPRDSARLLVDRGDHLAPEHRVVNELPELLRDGDLLVVNDSKVIPARLRLVRATGGAAEVLLLDSLDAERRTWEALVRPARKLKPGEVLCNSAGVELVRVGERTLVGDTLRVEILGDADPLTTLALHGEMPLPPYITAPLATPDRYQTVYANEPGSAAAPTAGLHLTPALFTSLEAKGVEMARVELVVGLDTFKPISTEDPTQHPMHSERYRVPPETTQRCHSARRVVAVGTTAVRALESQAASGESEGRTRLLIHRPYNWQVVDLLMTNFHMPRTTLLMMIDAFIGPRWRSLYDSALANEYRFLSFGDAMLLDRKAT